MPREASTEEGVATQLQAEQPPGCGAPARESRSERLPWLSSSARPGRAGTWPGAAGLFGTSGQPAPLFRSWGGPDASPRQEGRRRPRVLGASRPCFSGADPAASDRGRGAACAAEGRGWGAQGGGLGARPAAGGRARFLGLAARPTSWPQRGAPLCCCDLLGTQRSFLPSTCNRYLGEPGWALEIAPPGRAAGCLPRSSVSK